MRTALVAVFLVAAIAPLPALAVEDCELYDVDYSVIGYSPAHKQVAVRLALKFTPCVFTEEGYPEQKFEFVEVYTSSGTLRRRFFWTGRRADLDALKKLDPDILPKQLQPYLKEKVLDRKQIDAYLVEGKFEPVASNAKSPSGACTLALADQLLSERDFQPADRQYDLQLVRDGRRTRVVPELLHTSGKLAFAAFWHEAPFVLLRLHEREIFAPGMGGYASTSSLRFVKLPAEAASCWAPAAR